MALSTIAYNGLTSPLGGSIINSGTVNGGAANPLTSGTAVTFTGIPSWVKRITVMFQGVSTSGSSNFFIRLGTASGIDSSSGYTGVSQRSAASASSEVTFGTSFLINVANATTLLSGNAVFTLLNASTNLWTFTFTGGDSANSAMLQCGGYKTLTAGVLTQLIVGSANGTDTFDAGSINILYE